MAKERISMRKLKEVFRLKFECGLSDRQISKSYTIARSTVAEYIFRLKHSGMSWEELKVLSDDEVNAILFPVKEGEAKERPLPDFALVHEELKKNKAVTVYLLWQEYKETYQDGYCHSWFNEQYRKYKE